MLVGLPLRVACTTSFSPPNNYVFPIMSPVKFLTGQFMMIDIIFVTDADHILKYNGENKCPTLKGNLLAGL